MFLLVRDEDAVTVSDAVSAFADEQGLEPLDLAAQPQNLAAMIGLLGGPRVTVSEGGGQVLVDGLASLDVAEAEEWGEHLSRACNAEVIAIEIADDGLRLHVFDDGELDEVLEVPLGAGGHTATAHLVELSDSDEGRRALTSGIAAADLDELASGILQGLGALDAGPDAIALAFHDPLSDESDNDVDDEPAALTVEPVPGAELAGQVGGAVSSAHGHLFDVTVQGVAAIEGLRLELSGDALTLFLLDRVEVSLRVRGGPGRETRVLSGASIDLADALLERIPTAPPGFDLTDMFATMQRLTSALDAQGLNRLTVQVSGIGTIAGQGELVLRVSPLAGATQVGPGENSVLVRVG